MSKLKVLLKNDLTCFLRATFSPKSKKKKQKGKTKANSKAGFIALCIFMYSLFFMYSISLALISQDQCTDLVLLFGVSFGTMMALLFTITNAHPFLFQAKDYELLSSLPVDTKEIITSKLITVSLLGYLYFSFCYLPSYISYLIFHFSVVSLICGFLVFLLVPLLVVTISAFLSLLIGKLTAKMKHKGIITSIFYAVILGSIMVFSFSIGMSFSNDFEESADYAFVIRDKFASINPLSEILSKAASGNILNMLLLIAICLIPFAIFIFVCSKYYVSINESSKNGYKNKNFELKQEKTNTPMGALLKKELRTLVGTPIYFINVAISPIIGALCLIAMSFAFGSNLSSENIEGVVDVINILPMGLMALSGWMFGMAPATVVSINMEGKTFWLTKSLPISEKKLLWSKLLFSILLYLPFIIISSTFSIILIQPNWIDAIFFYLVPTVYAIAFSMVGLIMNLRFYNIEWNNPTEAVKSGVGVFLAMLIDFGISSSMIIPIVLGTIFNMTFSYLMFLIGCLFVFIFGRNLLKSGVKKYNEILC